MQNPMPVHPAADIFPMLGEDELDDLAADIKSNGLLHAIVRKGGVLIDGRNRLEACRRAGVEPRFEELNGADPIAHILSANIARRHMTKGQRAMAVAMIYPDATKYKRGGANSSVSEDLSGSRVSMARTVLKWAPELADGVLRGAGTLDQSYATASGRKLSAEAPVKRLESLRARDPDLADKVVEGYLTLDDAEGAAHARREKERAARQGTYDILESLKRHFFMFGEAAYREDFWRIIKTYPQEISADEVKKDLSAWVDALNLTIKGLPK